MARTVSIILLFAAMVACGTTPPPVRPPVEAAGKLEMLNSSEHLLLEPSGDPVSLLGRPVIRRPDGGYEIGDAVAPGCRMTMKETVSSWKRTFYQSAEDVAGFSANLSKLASLKTEFKTEMRMAASVTNQKVISADLKGTCRGLLITSVKVGTGHRMLQYRDAVSAGAHAGWKSVSAGFEGRESESAGESLSWEVPQAWSFTLTDVSNVDQVAITIQSPGMVRIGETFHSDITIGNRDLWLIVLLCRDDACRILHPDADNKRVVLGPGQTLPIELTAAETPLRERIVVYGFSEEEDYATFAPPAGSLTLEEQHAYANNLASRLKQIPAKRWGMKDYRVSYVERLPTDPPGPAHTWIAIEGGSFEMGSDTGRNDEKPLHQVSVDAFEILRTEVTVDQYAECASCTPPKDKSDNPNCNWGHSDRGDDPVNCVDWSQASEYCEFIGGRLPTEAEWEYAARSRGDVRKYPWGNETPTCKFATMRESAPGCGNKRTQPVCTSQRGVTDQAVCDMAGNVWEWVADRYHESYEDAPSDGSAWLTGDGKFRVLRGGSWLRTSPEETLSTTHRHRHFPSKAEIDFGFRCVK